MVTVMSIGSAAILQMSGAYVTTNENFNSSGYISGGYIWAVNGYNGLVSGATQTLYISGGIILAVA